MCIRCYQANRSIKVDIERGFRDIQRDNHESKSDVYVLCTDDRVLPLDHIDPRSYP